MKKHILAAGAAVLALGTASIASAASTPCAATYMHPVSAKSIKAALTQAFVSCNNPGGNTDNATTESGTVPTCYPAETFHENAGSPDFGWTWGPKGKGDISFKASKNKLCGPPLAPATDCNEPAADLAISVKISDIRDHTGIASGTFGAVQTLARATLIDRAEPSAPMTVIDFPTGFGIGVTNGKVNKKTSATEILSQPSLNQPALPPCTTIEVVSVLVKDPNGNTFANIGTYLP